METWHWILLILIVIIAIVLISGRTPIINPESNVPDGKMCGGIAGFQCEVGYYCEYSKGTQPSFPDESGTCIQCPQYMPPSEEMIIKCRGIGGEMVSEKDSRGCNSPPKCSSSGPT